MSGAGRGRKPISASQRIGSAPGEVWAVISAPGNLEECHPFCAANPVDSWPGAGSRDSIEYYNGRVVDRQFTDWQEGGGYDIEVFDSSASVASVSWRITQADHAAELTIDLTPDLFRGIPAPVRWVPLVVVRPMLRRYLRSVLRGVEWRVTTGRPVRRNQFGAHPWFSARVTKRRPQQDL